MGIAVVDVDTGWSTGFNETTFLPQQSVSKTWVTLTALEMAEKGLLDLDSADPRQPRRPDAVPPADPE